MRPDLGFFWITLRLITVGSLRWRLGWLGSFVVKSRLNFGEQQGMQEVRAQRLTPSSAPSPATTTDDPLEFSI